MKNFKDNKKKFIIIRVTENEYDLIHRLAQDFKNISQYIREKLGLNND